MSDDVVRDSNGNELNDGDSVTGIRLTGRTGEVECSTKQVKGLVLKTEFLKKA